jgi:hypothetical protein
MPRDRASQVGAPYRDVFAAREPEVDLRWILRARRNGVTMALSTTKLTRTASPRTAWLVENAHTTAAPIEVPTTVNTRNAAHMRRRTDGRSVRNRVTDVCSSPDLKRAQQTSTAGIISKMIRTHSTVVIVLGYGIRSIVAGG